jgi:centrosomal protein CEP135
LADAKSDLEITKRKLMESEQTVHGLKNQIQHYVIEVRRAEELLMEKERERDEMLDTYKSLSHETYALEENNLTLATEKAETK